MNSEIRKILEDNNLLVKKITLKGNVKIIDTGSEKFVIKKKRKDLNNLYKYLSSRAFEYFPKKIIESNNYYIYEYVDGVEIPFEQKIFDMIHLVSILHNKTTFYKTIDSDEYKFLYEDVLERVEYLQHYYDDLVSLFEREEYMSPSSYLISRNISMVFEVLGFCRYNINKWYEIISEKKRVRVVNLHNNLSMDHFIKGDGDFLISWEESKRDLPIYDLINLFNRYYYEIDFCDLLRSYENNYPLLNEERILLLVLISMPSKLLIEGNEYECCLKVKKFYDKLKAASVVVSDYVPKENN